MADFDVFMGGDDFGEGAVLVATVDVPPAGLS